MLVPSDEGADAWMARLNQLLAGGKDQFGALCDVDSSFRPGSGGYSLSAGHQMVLSKFTHDEMLTLLDIDLGQPHDNLALRQFLKPSGSRCGPPAKATHAEEPHVC